MPTPFTFSRPSDRVTSGSWALATGTARTGYGLTNLDDGDPSTPLWITGSSLSVVRDMGSATRVDAVDIFAHTFASGCDLRVQMHTSDSWGTPDVTLTPTIVTPYEDGFTYHIRADIATAYPTVGNRTKRYLRVANLSANSVTVAVGEICIWGLYRTLTRGVRYGFQQVRERLTSSQASKRGIQTVYDLGSVARMLHVDIPATDTDFDDLRALEASARGNARAFSVVFNQGHTKARFNEPLYVRLANRVSDAEYARPNVIPTTLMLQELGRGELVGA